MLKEDGAGVEKREEALALMRSALGMIDEAGGPHDVGAHLDLAICRLEEALAEARVAKESGRYPADAGSHGGVCPQWRESGH